MPLATRRIFHDVISGVQMRDVMKRMPGPADAVELRRRGYRL